MLPAKRGCDSIPAVDEVYARQRIQAEMREAFTSRSRGNEGRARVCARRAVGLALAATLGTAGRTNAYDLLRHAAESPGYAEAVRQAAGRLATRVTPEHRLPHAQDPLQDARLILNALGLSPAEEEADGSNG